MENLPNYDQRIIEALEVCRPGSDDFDDPALQFLAKAIKADAELARLYGLLQEVDGRVAAAFADVPVPAGLETRLRERLEIGGGQGSSAGEGSEQLRGGVAAPEGAAPCPPGEAAVEPLPAALRRGKRTRRWLLVGGGTAVAAVLLIGAMIVFRDSGTEYTPQAVWGEAIRFYKQETRDAGRRADPPSDYPFSAAVARLPNIEWRRFSGLLESRGVAYDFRGPPGVQATLYVLKQQVPGLDTGPDLRPSYSTGGYSVEAWQEDGLLYVLVVNSGDWRTYQQFIRHRPGPLT